MPNFSPSPDEYHGRRNLSLASIRRSISMTPVVLRSVDQTKAGSMLCGSIGWGRLVDGIQSSTWDLTLGFLRKTSAPISVLFREIIQNLFLPLSSSRALPGARG